MDTHTTQELNFLTEKVVSLILRGKFQLYVYTGLIRQKMSLSYYLPISYMQIVLWYKSCYNCNVPIGTIK